MNKQELIEKYKELENGSFDIAAIVVCQLVLKDLEQLDEPEKVVVPQFVADYIEYTKDEDYHLFVAMCEVRKHENKEIDHWLYTDDNTELFARAWLDGYEIEKEKRYYIRLKGVDENYNFLNFIKHLNAWVLDSIKTDKKFRTTHTRKELEDANFGWVFDCPGIEIEEVE